MQALPQQPLVSVIMPVYNAAPYLKQAIESILNQTYPNFELLICDDASTDGSVEVIKTFGDGRIRPTTNHQNLGYLKICNQLFQEAKGDIITFQDADDWSELDRLDAVVEAFKNNSNTDFCLSYYKRVNASGELIEECNSSFSTQAFGHDANYWTYFCGASIAVRKKVLENIGGYNNYFDKIGGEDYDWLFRIANKFEGIQIERSLYNYRLHDSVVKQSNDWRKYYILDLIKAGRKLCLQEGKDYLASENSDWLGSKVKELETPFKKDPTHLLKIQATSLLNSGKRSEAVAQAFKAFRLKPFGSGNLIFFIKLNYWVLRRVMKI